MHDNFAVILILLFFCQNWIWQHFNFAVESKMRISRHFDVAIVAKMEISWHSNCAIQTNKGRSFK